MKKTKRIIAVTLIVISILSLMPLSVFGAGSQITDDFAPPVMAFTDVSKKQWSYDYIKEMYDMMVINGKTDTTFAPADFVTRAEFVKMLGCVYGIETDDYTGSNFTDVKASAWYAPYVKWAVASGVTKGVSANCFEPNEHITRQDMAVMICRFADNFGFNLPASKKAITFKDKAKIASYAKVSVTQMQKAGIINGVKNKDKSYSFNPTANASREETAKMLAVLYDLLLQYNATEQGAAYLTLWNWVTRYSNARLADEDWPVFAQSYTDGQANIIYCNEEDETINLYVHVEKNDGFAYRYYLTLNPDVKEYGVTLNVVKNNVLYAYGSGTVIPGNLPSFTFDDYDCDGYSFTSSDKSTLEKNVRNNLYLVLNFAEDIFDEEIDRDYCDMECFGFNV